MAIDWDNRYESERKPWTGVSDWFKATIKKHVPTPKTVLDLGCGTGDKSLWLAEQGYQVTGIDISKDAIKRAEIARGTASNPIFIHADMTELATISFTTKPFGLIVDLISSQFLLADKQLALLKEIRKMLTAEGLLVHTRIEATGDDAPEWVKKLSVNASDFEKSLIDFKIEEHSTYQSTNLADTTVHRYVLS